MTSHLHLVQTSTQDWLAFAVAQLQSGLIDGKAAKVDAAATGILGKAARLGPMGVVTALAARVAPSDAPVLAHLCVTIDLREAAAARQALREQAACRYVRAIAATPHLASPDKARLCAARWRGTSAASAALAAGNTGLAAAILCGALESGCAGVHGLLAAIDVTPADVLAALSRATSNRLRLWGLRLNVALDSCYDSRDAPTLKFLASGP
jgi:hypothetical protein